MRAEIIQWLGGVWERILQGGGPGGAGIDPGVRAAIAISLGAIPGALSRYYLTLGFVRWLGPAFPYGTLVANVTGAIVMGGFMTFTLDRSVAMPELRLWVTTGFLGSYTTFSTYALETHSFLREGHYTKGLLYGLGSVICGVLGCELGSLIARRFP
jgi:fluoride exporter